MLTKKIFLTMIGLIVAVAAVNTFSSPNIQENFWGQAGFTTKTMASVKMPHRGEQALQNQFISTPSLQSTLAPRLSNVGYGANIRYKLPERKHLGTPVNPLTYKNVISNGGGGRGVSRENYGARSQSSCSSDSCTEQPQYMAGEVLPSNFASGDFNKVQSQVWGQDSSVEDIQSALPVGDMTGLNALGEVVQPVIYQNYVYANRNKRTRSQGDMIRGDLAIAPNSTGWFQVSANPSIDLQQGAMNVMGGLYNNTSRAMQNIVWQDSGNSNTTLSGLNVPVHDLLPDMMSTQFDIGGQPIANQTVNVTAFP